MAESRAQGESLIRRLRGVIPTLAFLLAASVAGAPRAQAKTPPQASAGQGTRLMISGKSLHLSCGRSLRDLNKNKLECFGNVYIRRPAELLTADYAIMDMATEQLHAEGNVVYFTPDTVIYGTEMDFNFVTETGVIKDGRVESDKYQLVGEKIERLSSDHFIATDGEYTTCRDCPASWKIAGRKVDLTIDGYAHLSQVFIKVNDAPTLYLPYAVIPVKTKRQSGLLFPKLQPASAHGFTYVQPYFWAISRSQDLTLGAGLYSLRGPKGELRHRYVLSGQSSGELNAYYLRDKQFIEPYQDRWAVDYRHSLSFPWHVEQRLRILEASDRDYPRQFGDLSEQTRGEPALISTASLSRSGRDLTTVVSASRLHNLMTSSLIGFDGNTVQVVPTASVVSADHRISERVPLHWSLRANYSRFGRTGGSFDPIYPTGFTKPSGASDFFLPGATPLRKAQRFNLVPELYYTALLGDLIEIVPSVQYRTFYYLFDEAQAAPVARGYLLAQNEIAVSLEKVYAGQVKHKFRPSLVYSNIPVIQEKESHPFIRQIKKSGNQFDDFDIVPITNDTPLYFVPLGNSLSYRLSNKFILKSEDGASGGEPVYRKTVDLTAGQSVNFIEMRESPSTREPLSPFFSLLTIDTLRLGANGEFYYYPYIKRSRLSASAKYTFAKYTRRLLDFERSVGLSYASNRVIGVGSKSVGGSVYFSINDFFALTGGIDYLFPNETPNEKSPGLVTRTSAGIVYQSPSQCYKINLTGSWSIDNQKVAVNLAVPINLTGEGFTNLQEGGGLSEGR